LVVRPLPFFSLLVSLYHIFLVLPTLRNRVPAIPFIARCLPQRVLRRNSLLVPQLRLMTEQVALALTRRKKLTRTTYDNEHSGHTDLESRER
jgi:hypothetical protein